VAVGLAWWLLGGSAEVGGPDVGAPTGGADAPADPTSAGTATPGAAGGAGPAVGGEGQGAAPVAAPTGSPATVEDPEALAGPFTLDEAGAAAAVSATAVRVAACRKLTAASAKGDVKVELVVKPTMEGERGYVESVAVLDGDRKLLGACLTDAFSSARFPAPASADGARLPVTVPAP